MGFSSLCQAVLRSVPRTFLIVACVVVTACFVGIISFKFVNTNALESSVPQENSLSSAHFSLLTDDCQTRDLAIPRDLVVKCYWLSHEGFLLPVMTFEFEAAVTDSALVLVTGGPGEGGLFSSASVQSWLDWYQASGLNQALVLYGSRGTKGSLPSWRCDEYELASLRMIGLNLSYAEELRQSLPILNKCLASFDRMLAAAPFNTTSNHVFAIPIDVDATTTAINNSQYENLPSTNPETDTVETNKGLGVFATAQQSGDLLALMAALRFRDYHLWGVSYGSRVVLQAAAEFESKLKLNSTTDTQLAVKLQPDTPPFNITSLILDSIYPFEFGKQSEWGAILQHSMELQETLYTKDDERRFTSFAELYRYAEAAIDELERLGKRSGGAASSELNSNEFKSNEFKSNEFKSNELKFRELNSSLDFRIENWNLQAQDDSWILNAQRAPLHKLSPPLARHLSGFKNTASVEDPRIPLRLNRNRLLALLTFSLYDPDTAKIFQQGLEQLVEMTARLSSGFEITASALTSPISKSGASDTDVSHKIPLATLAQEWKGDAVHFASWRNQQLDRLVLVLEIFIASSFDPYFNSLVFFATECIDNGVEPSEIFETAIAPYPEWRNELRLARQYDVCALPVFSNKYQPLNAAYANLPTLLLSGELDPVTPLSWAQSLALQLPQSLLIEAKGVGHSVIMSEGCKQDLLSNWIAAQTTLAAGLIVGSEVSFKARSDLSQVGLDCH